MRVRLLAANIALLMLAACGTEQTDVMFECASPTGEKIATFYRVSTGDRPGDQMMKLNIRRSGDAFDAAMHSFAFRHGYDAILRWDSDTALRVDYPRGSDIKDQETAVFGTSQTFSSTDPIHITYTELESTHGHFMVEQRCF